LITDVVLPQPPFWLHTAIMRALGVVDGRTGRPLVAPARRTTGGGVLLAVFRVFRDMLHPFNRRYPQISSRGEICSRGYLNILKVLDSSLGWN
jgi:hypothetical protein